MGEDGGFLESPYINDLSAIPPLSRLSHCSHPEHILCLAQHGILVPVNKAVVPSWHFRPPGGAIKGREGGSRPEPLGKPKAASA